MNLVYTCILSNHEEKDAKIIYLCIYVDGVNLVYTCILSNHEEKRNAKIIDENKWGAAYLTKVVNLS